MNSKFGLILLIIFLFITSHVNAAQLKKIEIFGNERISSDTIKLFSEISLQDKLDKVLECRL